MSRIIAPYRFAAAASNGLLAGLESYYKLDEASGTIADSHGSNDSTSTSNVTYGATGIINDGLDFSGTTSYTSHGDVLDFDSTDPHSFSMWINPDTDGTLEIPLSKYDTSGRRGYFVFLDSNDKPFYTLRNNDTTNFLQIGATTDTIKAADGLVHLVVTYDGSEAASGVTIYINGSSVSLTTSVDTLSATTVSTAPFNISSRNDGSNSFNGVIDEVGVWSRELSATDVTNLYNSGSGLSYDSFDYSGAGLLTSLDSYYKLDEASGTIVDSHGSNDSTAESGLTYGATGIINDAITFNSDDYISMGDVLDFNYNEPVSISAWINLDSSTRALAIVSKRGADDVGYNLIRRGSGASYYLSFLMQDTGGGILRIDSPTGYSTTGTWYHVVSTYDGSGNASGAKLYVDGVDIGATTTTDTLSTTTTNTTDFNIGNRNSGGSPVQYFMGEIDEVGIWSKELTALEVLNLYKGGAGMPYSEFES